MPRRSAADAASTAGMKLAGLKLDRATPLAPDVEEGKPEARPYTPIGEIMRSITGEPIAVARWLQRRPL